MAVQSGAANRVGAAAKLKSVLVPEAMAALQAGKPADAIAAYHEMAKVTTRGASIATMGRADVAMYEGRYADARAELQAGAASDEAGNLQLPRALKLIRRRSIPKRLAP